MNNAEVFQQIWLIRIADLWILIAKEMTEFAKSQIVRQAGMAMLTQANAIPNQVAIITVNN